MGVKTHLFITVAFMVSSSFLCCYDIGDPCPGGNPGVCTRISDCASAKNNIKLKKKPPICFFKDQEPIICCSDKNLKPKTFSSNGGTGDIAFINIGNSDGCPPVSINRPTPRKAQKSFEKCLDYQKKYVYPCVEGPLLKQKKMRANFCTWSPEKLISNGKDAALGEFPHMALLGFGTTTVVWKCGGTILSERFVLTAAHCTKSPERGPVTKIKIGILSRSEPDSKKNLYNVLKIHKHKKYHSPQKYNDIALLETDREMLLYPFALPACLHDGTPVNDTEVIATGWGTTKADTKDPANILQKATLHRFQDSECIRFHHEHINNRNILGGFDNQTQICFGDKMSHTNTCPGDSGGPVQIRHPGIYCMYLILGVTSYGRSCDLMREPGIYTRVSHYLPWIESIVWS